MLEVSNLAFVRQRKPLFQHLTKTFSAGKITYVVGANGVGKTTLLKILCGVLTPDEGNVCYDGAPVDENFEAYCAKFVFIGHQTAINDVLTVTENLRFFAACYSAGSDLNEKQVLEQVGLWQHRAKSAYQLSAGQRRRLSLTRLLISAASIWILDEPFTSLDKETVSMLEQWIIEQAKSGGSVIMTSHQTPSFGHDIMEEFELTSASGAE